MQSEIKSEQVYRIAQTKSFRLNSTEALFRKLPLNSMKHHSKSMIDHPFSLQSVCSSIEYTKLDNAIQREGLCWHTGKKISTARMKNSTDGVCVFFKVREAANFGIFKFELFVLGVMK